MYHDLEWLKNNNTTSRGVLSSTPRRKGELLDAIKEYPRLVEAIDVTSKATIEFILDSPPIIDLVATVHVVTLDESFECLRLCTKDFQIINGFTIIHNIVTRLFMEVLSKILKKNVNYTWWIWTMWNYFNMWIGDKFKCWN